MGDIASAVALSLSPDHCGAYREARSVMAELNISKLPVDPFQIAEELGIDVFAYSDVKVFRPSTIQKLRADECAAVAGRDIYDDSFHIMFDDVQPPDRIRFTIAHEIGHIRLGHVTRHGNYLARSGCFLHKKNDPVENEADSFAGELLRPPGLLFLLKLFDPPQIVEACQVTHTAAMVGARQAKQMDPAHNLHREAIEFYSNQYYHFVYEKYCFVCHHGLIDENAAYCPVCGSQEFFREDRACIMRFPSIQLDQNGKAVVCPRCGNDEIDPAQNYCKICGTYLLNHCDGRHEWSDFDHCDVQTTDPCGAIAQGNARYCTVCGCPTTFYTHGVLKAWDASDKPSSTQDIAPDDEIPF